MREVAWYLNVLMSLGLRWSSSSSRYTHMLTSVQCVFLTAHPSKHLRNPSHVHVQPPPSQQVVTSSSAQIWSAVKAEGEGGSEWHNWVVFSLEGEWRQKSERPRGIRKVSGRSLIETGWKKSERLTKSNWEGTCRRTGEHAVGDQSHPPPPLISA